MSFSLTYRRLAFIWSNTKKSAEFELRLNGTAKRQTSDVSNYRAYL